MGGFVLVPRSRGILLLRAFGTGLVLTAVHRLGGCKTVYVVVNGRVAVGEEGTLLDVGLFEGQWRGLNVPWTESSGKKLARLRVVSAVRWVRRGG